jgi:hypothetical protein
MMIISGGRGGCHGNDDDDNYSNAPPLYYSLLSPSNFTTPQIEEIDTLSLLMGYKYLL